MTVDDARLAELRRIAFGRTYSPDDEARAAAARHELEAALTVADDTTSPLPGPPPVASHLEAPSVAEPVEAPAEPHRARRLTWLAPTAVALVVGLLLGAGSMIATGRAAPAVEPAPAFTPGSSELPPSVAPLSANHPVEPSQGDVEAAQLWFAGAQRPEDEIDRSMMAGLELDPASTRMVYTDHDMVVWIGRTGTDDFCVLAMPNTAGSGGGICVTPVEFASGGIALNVKGSLSVVWNGQRFITSTSAGQQRDVRP
ncbi:hypothetical protein [Conyzicola sp.]|uniref:hypothetical protein n=1 Tax=Conyzicola sp. TaxID=1969404 RepID=UPI0039894765